MKKLFTLVISVAFFGTFSPQEVITDVSPDGAISNTYIYAPSDQSNVRSQDVPYGTAPSWQAKRDRQIGGIAFGDFDNDGDLDLAIGCYYSNSYPPINDYENLIFRNNNGILDTIPAWISSDERSTTEILWADVNMDGLPDLLSANGNFQHSTLYLNYPDSGLSKVPAWISNDNVFTVGAAFCDIDGDGDLDLALANQGMDPLPYRPIQIFYNNDGILSTTPNWSSTDQMITNSVAFADMNNSDLAQDNVTYSATGTEYAFLLKMTPVYSIDVVAVNGVEVYNYTFDPIHSWLSIGHKPAAGSQVDISYTYVKHGDMAACKWANFESGVYFNNNTVMNGTPGWKVGHISTQKGIGWADIDLDGFMDLAIGGSGMPTQIYKNNNGILSSTPYWSSGSSSTSSQDLIWGDVNKDGYPDLAVVHFGYKRVEIFINRGGNLDIDPTWTYQTATSATALAFGDVNGDGWLDLAVGTAREPVMVFIADPSLIPVELASFTGTIINDGVLLEWITTTEKNNSGFEVERTANFQGSGTLWNKIAFIPGIGTTTEPQKYTFKDFPEGSGKYTYRLKQIDHNGTYTYSGVVEVNVVNSLSLTLEQNYPNPFNPETMIRYQIPAAGERSFVTLKVYDMLGREVAQLVNDEKSGGEYEVIFNAGDYEMSSGVYFYTLTAGEMMLTKKFVLSK